jgi:hypothetical protein
VFQVRRSSPEQSPPRRATPSPTTAPELTRTGRPASPRGPPPRAPTPPRTDAEPVPTKTSGADGGVLEQRLCWRKKRSWSTLQSVISPFRHVRPLNQSFPCVL